ncbi:MAG: alpha/beta hydrolase [Bryobacteraceae bacterium]
MTLRLVSQFLGFAFLLAAQTPPVPVMPAGVAADFDVEYSTVGARVAMDIVRPRIEPSEARPAVILVHGGGFRRGNRQSYLPLAIKLAERGYVAATVSYRLAPRHQFPAPVHDVKAAVRFLRANAARFQIDPDRIGAFGSSAGGHLALFLGLTPDVKELEGAGRIKSFRAVFPVWSTTTGQLILRNPMQRA